jgi:hypothetical protein
VQSQSTFALQKVEVEDYYIGGYKLSSGVDNPYKSVDQHKCAGNVLPDRTNNISSDLNHLAAYSQSHVTSM